MGDAPAVRTRVLVVADPDPGEPGLPEALRVRGFDVAVRTSGRDGVDLLNGDGADVAVVALPVADLPLAALCTAVKESAWAPVLILAEAGAEAEAATAELPESLQPDAIVPRPVDAGKLAIEIHEHLRALDFTGEADAEAVGVTLPELLLELERRRDDVVLEVRGPDLRVAIHLRAGQPVFAEGGSLQETLGRLLLRQGEIDQDQYAQVVQRMTEGLYTHESVRMGEVLVQMGLLTPPQVYDALSRQVREKIVACFQWKRFAYDLIETVEEDDELGIFQCPPVGALILAGMSEHYEADRLQPWLGRLADGLPVLRRPAAAVAERFQLRQAEQKLLQALDGTRPLHALLGGDVPEGAPALLAALSLCRELVLEDAPPEAAELPSIKLPTPKPRQAAPAPAPGAPRRAAPDDAPAPVTARPRVERPQPGSATDSAETLRRQLGGARRAPVDARQARLEAENAFNQALRLYRESLLPGALKEFRRAAQLAPDEPEYRMMEAWLEYRTARGKEKGLAAEKLRGTVARMLEHSRGSARAHSILGQLAHADGDAARAMKHLKLAVRSDPEEPDANRLLRVLHMRERKKR